jgi:hypothetical protein
MEREWKWLKCCIEEFVFNSFVAPLIITSSQQSLHLIFISKTSFHGTLHSIFLYFAVRGNGSTLTHTAPEDAYIAMSWFNIENVLEIV